MHFDWLQFRARNRPPESVVDPHRRIRLCLGLFWLALLVVFGRLVQLEITQGAAWRKEAAQPLTRRVSVPSVRGRLLSRDGVVLAADRKVLALALHYRYLQQPSDPAWLRAQARSRLPAKQRRDAQLLAAAQAEVQSQRDELCRRLAQLCHLSPQQWERRARQIQARVQRIAESVNRRMREAADQQAEASTTQLPAQSWWERLLEGMKASVAESPGWITVAEERDYHVMADDVPLDVVAEIETHPQLYRGVKIVQRWQRDYPQGPLAAHLLGYLGPPEPGEHAPARQAEDPVGRSGLERRYESLLAGRRGTLVEHTDHGGHLLSQQVETAPVVGRDLVLTIDSRLQQAAEQLLDQALQRRAVSQVGAAEQNTAGGAVVVMDVHGGALLAAASAPRFDPNIFVRGTSPQRQAILTDGRHPLFDRVAGAALAPGSVFKILTALALLESARLDPHAALTCRGYLDHPDRWRCDLYQQRGQGHGAVALADALAQSCNVYFFQHARHAGPEPLLDWAQRLGFGQRTGVDLPGESAGTLPTPETIERLENHPWRTADTLELCIGQGSLTVTPLQMARLTAAVANGGRLVAPHAVGGLGLTERRTAETDDQAPDLVRPAPAPVPGLHSASLQAIAEGLRRTVSDPAGTAYAAMCPEPAPVAGKTGTAQTGPDRPSHAWFAGYVPADQPRWALVVVLEHAGSGSTAAVPVARRLVQQMRQMGLVASPPEPAD